MSDTPTIDTATRPDIRAACDRYAATFGSRDTARIKELHAENGTFWLHTGREQVRGRDAIAATFDGFFTAWPEFGFEVHRTLFTATGWILDWSVTAVLPGNNGAPRPVRFDALDVVDIDDSGLVVRKDTYIDMVQVQAALSG